MNSEFRIASWPIPTFVLPHMASDPKARVRTFIAISVPAGVSSAFVQLQRSLEKQTGVGLVHWTSPDQFHLTLSFLGHIAPAAAAQAGQALTRLCAAVRPFELGATGVGCFPNLRRPKIIWAGLTGQIEELSHLQKSVEGATHHLSEKPSDRQFHPHLTLGRVRPSSNRSQTRRLAASVASLSSFSVENWTVRELRLMRSDLSGQGAIHTCLSVHPII
jgi:2'-5' RNA ligase